MGPSLVRRKGKRWSGRDLKAPLNVELHFPSILHGAVFEGGVECKLHHLHDVTRNLASKYLQSPQVSAAAAENNFLKHKYNDGMGMTYNGSAGKEKKQAMVMKRLEVTAEC